MEAQSQNALGSCHVARLMTTRPESYEFEDDADMAKSTLELHAAALKDDIVRHLQVNMLAEANAKMAELTAVDAVMRSLVCARCSRALFRGNLTCCGVE